MDQALTQSAAKELGRAFRFVRQAKQVTLRDAAKLCGVSSQYIMNVEQGSRLSVSDDVFKKLGAGYHMPEETVANLLLKARVMTALERRGLDAPQRAVAWRGLEMKLAELDIDPEDGIKKMVTGLYGS